MSDCSGCHEPRVQGGETVRVGPTGLPSACRVTEAFAGKHPVHLSLELHQKKVSCDQCHPTVRVAENMAQLILTQGRDTMMKSCGACHGTARFPKAHALTDCAKCHIDECFTIGGSSVPAWHVRGTSR
jgi:c(7)-type cytochrome triheme protein